MLSALSKKEDAMNLLSIAVYVVLAEGPDGPACLGVTVALDAAMEIADRYLAEQGEMRPLMEWREAPGGAPRWAPEDPVRAWQASAGATELRIERHGLLGHPVCREAAHA